MPKGEKDRRQGFPASKLEEFELSESAITCPVLYYTHATQETMSSYV